MREPPLPPPPNPAEGLSREWPELEAFGAEWVKRWLVLGRDWWRLPRCWGEVYVDGKGDMAETGGHPSPLHDRGLRG
jgi:hypothetical protein